MNEIALKKAIIGIVPLWMRTCNNKIDIYLLYSVFFSFEIYTVFCDITEAVAVLVRKLPSLKRFVWQLLDSNKT